MSNVNRKKSIFIEQLDSHLQCPQLLLAAEDLAFQQCPALTDNQIIDNSNKFLLQSPVDPATPISPLPALTQFNLIDSAPESPHSLVGRNQVDEDNKNRFHDSNDKFTTLNGSAMLRYDISVNSCPFRKLPQTVKTPPGLIQSGCTQDECRGSLMESSCGPFGDDEFTSSRIISEAVDFLNVFHRETFDSNRLPLSQRIEEVIESIESTGTYEHTNEELSYGVKLSWRNASRCIYRIQWRNIEVIDCRHVKSAEDMVEACVQHLKSAVTNGVIKSTISIFPQKQSGQRGPRIWNPQLLRYAGYRRSHLSQYGLDIQQDLLESVKDLLRPVDDGLGDILGDPSHVDFTTKCLEMGWRPPNGKAGWFDVLPIICEDADGRVCISDIPKEAVVEVPIVHDELKELKKYGIKWHAIPAISSFAMTIGGVTYSACPFNGWYMSAEIGCRNLGDTYRYNLLPLIGELMGFDKSQRSNKRSLWKDKALIELNLAVLTSFDKLGVSIVDHHSASDSFILFMEREQKARGYVTGDWVWITPPISGSTSQVFHQEMLKMNIKPMFMTFKEPSWKTSSIGELIFGSKEINQLDQLPNKSSSQRPQLSVNSLDIRESALKSHDDITKSVTKTPQENITVLVGTETGTAELFANRCLAQLPDSVAEKEAVLFEDICEPMLDYLLGQSMVVFFMSTSGEGEFPSLAAQAITSLNSCAKNSSLLKHLRFAVFGLCSSAYPQTFNKAAKSLAELLESLGATRVGEIGEGDELVDRESKFQEWQRDVFSQMNFLESENEPTLEESKWINALVSENKKLFRIADKGTWHLEIDSELIEYVAGDHLLVRPENKMKDVTKACKLLGYQYPELFSQVRTTIDLSGPCSMELLKALRERCIVQKNELVIQSLDCLIANPQSLNKQFNSVLDFLTEFSSVVMDWPIDSLLKSAPRISPRTYSISSSYLKTPGKLSLTISKHLWKMNDENKEGLCSTYLSELEVGDCLSIKVKPCPRFHLPPNISGKIILVASGTGIAPFRGFLQELEHKGSSAQVILLYGCRSQEEFLYREEIQQALHSRILSKCFVAYSQDARSLDNDNMQLFSNMYVQDIFEHLTKSQLTEFLTDASFFVCGSKAMGNSVKSTVGSLAEKAGHLDWLDTMIKNRKFILDIY